MRDIEKIIVHCSDTPEGRNNTIADIDAWHKERGFRRTNPPADAKYKHVGYHYVIHLDGTVHKGREEHEIGAHCTGHNSHSIGVCYIGGRDKWMKDTKDTRTKAQRDAMARLLMELVVRYPDARIYGHRDFARKDCPCFDAKEEYKML